MNYLKRKMNLEGFKMKTTIFIIVMILFFLYIGNFKMSFSPYNLEFPQWKLSISSLFLMCAIFFFYLHVREEAINEALKTIDIWFLKKDMGDNA